MTYRKACRANPHTSSYVPFAISAITQHARRSASPSAWSRQLSLTQTRTGEVQPDNGIAQSGQS